MNLGQMERSKLRKVVSEISDVLAYINTETITNTSELLNAAAII